MRLCNTLPDHFDLEDNHTPSYKWVYLHIIIKQVESFQYIRVLKKTVQGIKLGIPSSFTSN